MDNTVQNQKYELKKMYRLKSVNINKSGVDVDAGLVDRLMDFGLFPGVEFEVVQKLSFSQVTVIRFHQTLLALSLKEFLCLEV